MDAFKSCEYTLARRQEAQCLSNFRRIKSDFIKLDTTPPSKSLESKLLFKIESLDSCRFKELLVSVVEMIEDAQFGNFRSTFGHATAGTSCNTGGSNSKSVDASGGSRTLYRTDAPKFHTSCFDPSVLQVGGANVDEIVNCQGQDVISAYCTRARGISKSSGGVAVLDSNSRGQRRACGARGEGVPSWPRNLSLAILGNAPGISLPRHQKIVDLLEDSRETGISGVAAETLENVAQPKRVQVSSADYTGAMYPPLHSYNSGVDGRSREPFEMPSCYLFRQRLRDGGGGGAAQHSVEADFDFSTSVDALRSNYCKEMSAMILRNEIFKGCMQSRLLYRLLSYKMASDKYATFKQDSVAINKCTMQITWGGMWGHWHFFNNCLVPETTFQDFLENVAAGKLDEDFKSDEKFNACLDFVTSLRAVPFTDCGELVGRDMYSDVVVSKYSEMLTLLHCWRSEIFAQMQTQFGVSASMDSLYDASAIARAKELHAQQQLEHETEAAASAAEDLEQQRREALPSYNADASNLSDFCSIDKIFPLDPQTPCMHIATTATAKEFINSAPPIFVAHLDAMISLLVARHRPVAGWNDVAKQLGRNFTRLPNQVSTWLFSTFYASNNAGTFSLNSQGLVKLMCHLQFACIYLSSSSSSPSQSHVYNFGVLRRIDFKNRHELQLLFERCAKISSLVNVPGGALVYTITLPLVSIQPSAPVATFSKLSKRRRRQVF